MNWVGNFVLVGGIKISAAPNVAVFDADAGIVESFEMTAFLSWASSFWVVSVLSFS